MNGIARLLLIVFTLALIGGGVFLATWDIPPPTQTFDKTLSDERFPR